MEEIRDVLLRMYQDTRDPDQQPYSGPGPVSADLMRQTIRSQPWTEMDPETLPMPYNGLRSR